MLNYFIQIITCLLKSLKTKNKILVVLNGPSLKKQKITDKHSTEFDMVFVNRGFIHKEYARN